MRDETNADHRPVIEQDPGTGRYRWHCPAGDAVWAEDPDDDTDPILTAEASARAHWRPDLFCPRWRKVS